MMILKHLFVFIFYSAIERFLFFHMINVKMENIQSSVELRFCAFLAHQHLYVGC